MALNPISWGAFLKDCPLTPEILFSYSQVGSGNQWFLQITEKFYCAAKAGEQLLET